MKLIKAINNNKGLYQGVFTSNEVPIDIKREIYYSNHDTPPLYSNLVTREINWKVDEVFFEIDKKFQAEGWNELSIKDSFQCLDLVPYGFSNLFDAQWIYLDSSDFRSTLTEKEKFTFREAGTTKELQQWICDWGEGNEVGNKIFNRQLLENPLFDFVTCFENDILVSVALLNRTDDVVGISNFFVEENVQEAWSALISFVHQKYGQVDITGYEQPKTTEQLLKLGICIVGNLTVWIKRR